MRIVIVAMLALWLSGCAGTIATSENLEGAPATLTPRRPCIAATTCRTHLCLGV
mgnify:CR=1 FL=1